MAANSDRMCFRQNSALLRNLDSEESETILEAISLAALAVFIITLAAVTQPDEDLWQPIRIEVGPAQMSAILQDQDSGKFKIILGALSLAVRTLSSWQPSEPY